MADTVKWGTPADDDAFGTGASPTDFTAADGGSGGALGGYINVQLFY